VKEIGINKTISMDIEIFFVGELSVFKFYLRIMDYKFYVIFPYYLESLYILNI
jgi:hypothetical protein